MLRSTAFMAASSSRNFSVWGRRARRGVASSRRPPSTVSRRVPRAEHAVVLDSRQARSWRLRRQSAKLRSQQLPRRVLAAGLVFLARVLRRAGRPLRGDGRSAPRRRGSGGVLHAELPPGARASPRRPSSPGSSELSLPFGCRAEKRTSAGPIARGVGRRNGGHRERAMAHAARRDTSRSRLGQAPEGPRRVHEGCRMIAEVGRVRPAIQPQRIASQQRRERGRRPPRFSKVLRAQPGLLGDLR